MVKLPNRPNNNLSSGDPIQVEIRDAATFHRFMSSGRTSPALIGCLDANDSEGEFVVKLSASCGTAGLLCEFMAAELADYFDIPHPCAALIDIGSDFLAAVVPTLLDEKADLLRRSEGLNFGTEKLNNLIPWPQDRVPTASQIEDAAAVFAFDVLLQNPDRRRDNPNMGCVGETIQVYDHELAFSFRMDFIHVGESWRACNQPYCSNHPLFGSLKKEAISLNSFIDNLRALPPTFVEDRIGDLPASWLGEDITKIADYLRETSANATLFGEDIKRRLA